jgi:hypothetical protein
MDVASNGTAAEKLGDPCWCGHQRVLNHLTPPRTILQQFRALGDLPASNLANGVETFKRDDPGARRGCDAALKTLEQMLEHMCFWAGPSRTRRHQRESHKH